MSSTSTSSVGIRVFQTTLRATLQACSRSAAPSTRRCIASYTLAALPSAALQHNARSPTRPARAFTRSLGPYTPGDRTGLRFFRILPGNSVITNYVDLPPNYTDEGGLPFSRTDITAEEAVAIFGPRISTLAANKLLRIMHGRRVAGTLEDPDLQIHTSPYTHQQKARALKYLRANVPVDEITCAGLRAEDELAAIEAMEGEDGEAKGAKGKGDIEQGGLGYKTRLRLFKEVPETQDELYGVGAFDRVRAANKARWAEELKRREQEKRLREEEEARQNPGGLAKVDPNQPRVPSVKMQQYLAAGQSELTEPPVMAKWERLVPATLLVLVATAVWAAYAYLYRPPARADRLFPDLPPAAATVGAIIAANLLVFIAWRVPPLWGMLNRHFVLTSATPRLTALAGAMISHQQFGHIVMNMAVLWLFGTRLHDDVGRGGFLAVFFGTGGLGFLGTLYALVLRDRLFVSTLGASGAVFGTMAAYLWLHRFDYFKLFGLPPDPFNGVQGLGILALVVALHIPRLLSRKVHNVDLASHLVGIASGVAAGHFFEKRLQAKKQWEQGRPVSQQKIQVGPTVVGDVGAAKP